MNLDQTVTPECQRIACDIPADSTTLAGATRVRTCWRHREEYLERYPEDRDLVWPISVQTERTPR